MRRPGHALVALLAAVQLVCACGTPVEVEGRAGRCERRNDAGLELFMPATYREGDRVVLPLTFHDGTTAELVYPPRLDLAALGLTPYGSASLRGTSPNAPLRSDVVSRDFWIFHGEVPDVMAMLNGGCRPPLLAEYEAADGRRVGFWDLPSHSTADYLAFQFGRWTVLVYDYAADGSEPASAMTEAERALWAKSFSGRETADGFVLLEGVHPLALQRAGVSHGPTLSLGTVDRPRWLTLYPGTCRRRVSRSNWCLSETMGIQASGTDDFVEALIRDVDVRKVVLR